MFWPDTPKRGLFEKNKFSQTSRTPRATRSLPPSIYYCDLEPPGVGRVVYRTYAGCNFYRYVFQPVVTRTFLTADLSGCLQAEKRSSDHHQPPPTRSPLISQSKLRPLISLISRGKKASCQSIFWRPDAPFSLCASFWLVHNFFKAPNWNFLTKTDSLLRKWSFWWTNLMFDAKNRCFH